jgi:hypothetical protein
MKEILSRRIWVKKGIAMTKKCNGNQNIKNEQFKNVGVYEKLLKDYQILVSIVLRHIFL